MSIALCAIGIFAYKELNTLVVVGMMIHLAIYQLSMGTYMFVYVVQVAEERAQTLGIGVTWFFVTILTLTTNTLFDTLGNAGTFWMFAGLTLAGAVVIQLVVRETKGLTEEQIKQLYVPQRLQMKNSITGIGTSVLDDASTRLVSPNQSPSQV